MGAGQFCIQSAYWVNADNAEVKSYDPQQRVAALSGRSAQTMLTDGNLLILSFWCAAIDENWYSRLWRVQDNRGRTVLPNLFT